jgi:hypothetical protein
MGTDYPVLTDNDLAQGSEQLRRAGLSAEDHARVCRLNAEILLPGLRELTDSEASN